MTDGIIKERNGKIFKRDPFDWYVEESRASEMLFEVERFVGAIWDPACGSGNILRSAMNAGYVAIGSDLVRRVDHSCVFQEHDFLAAGREALGVNIVCNPPFYRGKGTEGFIRRALEVCTGKIAVFASIGFLSGQARANGLFADHPPHRIWMVTPRVSCPPGEWIAAGNKAGGGTDDWVWMVWDQTAPAPAFSQLGWLRKKKEGAR